MDPLNIRLATLSDLDDIVPLIERDSLVRFPTHTHENYAKAFAEIATHPDNAVVVATLGNQVVGTLQLTFIPGLKGWRAQVEAVRVREDLRNQGIGARMMEWVIDRSRERGCYLVQLTTNAARKDAQRFYQRFGFEASHVGMKLYLEDS
jgi:GNAT superfamily N-acetyltransferase